MKKIAALVLSVATACALVSCGDDEEIGGPGPGKLESTESSQAHTVEQNEPVEVEEISFVDPGDFNPTIPSEYKDALFTARFCNEVTPNVLASYVATVSGYDKDLVNGDRKGPAQLTDETMEIYGTDEDGNGVVSAHDIKDSIFALSRMGCSQAARNNKVLADEGEFTVPPYQSMILTMFYGGQEYLDELAPANEGAFNTVGAWSDAYTRKGMQFDN